MNTNEAATLHIIWLAEQYQCAIRAGSRSALLSFSSPFLLLFSSSSSGQPPAFSSPDVFTRASHLPPRPLWAPSGLESSLVSSFTRTRLRAVRVRGDCSRESCRKSIFIHAHSSSNMCKSFIIPGFSLFSSLSPRWDKSARPPCSGSGELSGGRRARGRRRRANRRPEEPRRGGGQEPHQLLLLL